MFTIRDVLIEQERRQDKLRRAENGRLVRQIIPTNKFKQSFLLHLGDILVQAGSRLQTRYTAQSSAPLIRNYRAAKTEIRTQTR